MVFIGTGIQCPDVEAPEQLAEESLPALSPFLPELVEPEAVGRFHQKQSQHGVLRHMGAFPHRIGQAIDILLLCPGVHLSVSVYHHIADGLAHFIAQFPGLFALLCGHPENERHPQQRQGEKHKTLHEKRPSFLTFSFESHIILPGYGLFKGRCANRL